MEIQEKQYDNMDVVTQVNMGNELWIKLEFPDVDGTTFRSSIAMLPIEAAKDCLEFALKCRYDGFRIYERADDETRIRVRGKIYDRQDAIGLQSPPCSGSYPFKPDTPCYGCGQPMTWLHYCEYCEHGYCHNCYSAICCKEHDSNAPAGGLNLPLIFCEKCKLYVPFEGTIANYSYKQGTAYYEGSSCIECPQHQFISFAAFPLEKGGYMIKGQRSEYAWLDALEICEYSSQDIARSHLQELGAHYSRPILDLLDMKYEHLHLFIEVGNENK